MREELPRLLTEAHVYVSTSTFEETFGLAAIDAAAAGLPIVSFGAFGTADVVCNGWNAIIPKAPTGSAIADAMGELLFDPIRRAELGRNARRLVTHRFRETHMVQSYTSIFMQMMRVSDASNQSEKR
mmetsp:Transcript_48424/g.65914  ORF Transcript_48424/g.65914 Transcript_48424/m.65914 type:complete len:127 (-) Transcript_48424:355-735(-)